MAAGSNHLLKLHRSRAIFRIFAETPFIRRPLARCISRCLWSDHCSSARRPSGRRSSTNEGRAWVSPPCQWRLLRHS